jgi:hypothetical protein
MKSPLRQLHSVPLVTVESPPDPSISTVLDIHEMIARQKNKRWINTCL